MTVRRSCVRKSISLVVAVSLLFLSTGCIVIDSSSRARSEPEPEVDRSLSLKGTGRQFGRGAANVAFCWLELPSQIDRRVRDQGPGNPFGILSPIFGLTFGAISGSIRTVERAIGGVFEIGLSPFPSYEPLMDPALPPYLASIRPPCKEDCGCASCSPKAEEDPDSGEREDT